MVLVNGHSVGNRVKVGNGNVAGAFKPIRDPDWMDALIEQLFGLLKQCASKD